MALNKNHEFEELDGIKCGIVEKNVSPERVEFLKKLLAYNRFEVVVVPSPAPKAVATPKPTAQPAVVQPAAGSQQPVGQTAVGQSSVEQPAAGGQQPVGQSAVGQSSVEQSAAGSQQPVEQPPLPPQTFTVGVTDTSFNPINAIFGRQLKTPDGRIVTLAYWQQKENISNDEVPYYEQKL